MKQTYIFEYLNENDFRKKERTVRKYNMLAYKKLVFDFYPSFRDGNFKGVWYKHNLYDRTSKIILTRTTY